MKSPFKLLAISLLCMTGAANAIVVTSVQTSAGPFTSTPGVCTVDFNTVASLTNCANTSYSAGTSAHIVSGTTGGQFVQPANDPTAYLTVGSPSISGDVTITIAGAGDTYFGFYAGSIDSFNTVTFSNAGGSVTLNGNQINNFLVPGTGANGLDNGYFNVFTDSFFTSVTLSSSQAAFETDNHSFGIASPVPEPASVSLLGLGALGLLATRRRARK